MNASSLTIAAPSLADLVDETLQGALAGEPEPCLWCGSTSVALVSVDAWAATIVLRCRRCGSELEGQVERHLIEVPA
jgi:hypothetical protein